MNCKYCGSLVAPQANDCPYCGKKIPTAKKSRRQLFIIIGIAAVALIFIFTTFGTTLSSQQQTNAQLAKQAANSLPDLGISYDKFRDKFNGSQYAKPNNLALLSIDKTANTFEYTIAGNILVSGKIDPLSKKLLDIQMVAQPASQDDLVTFVTAMGMVIETLHPDTAAKTRSEVLPELGFKEGSDIRKADNISTKGDKTYHFHYDDKIGYIFSAKSSKEK